MMANFRILNLELIVKNLVTLTLFKHIHTEFVWLRCFVENVALQK